jgi:putative membrane-bound dehydrogenase-like protein
MKHRALPASLAILSILTLNLVANEQPYPPDKAVNAFALESGVQIQLVAAEPLVADPVAVSWDASGRMFVAENRGYPVGPDTGIIAMLEDTDGDGRMDKRTEFATNIPYPNGLMPWRGGFFVTSAPDVYYFKDTTGDGRADVRKVVLTGYMTNSTTQLRVAHPTLGLDGFVHVTAGLTGGKVTSPEHKNRKATEFKKSDSRFNPDTFEVEEWPGIGQFGLCFDDFGRKFNCSNRNPLKHNVVHPRYLKRNKYFAFSKVEYDVAPSGTESYCWPLSEDTTTAGFHPRLMATPHAGTFTSACGISIYRGNLLPKSFYGSGICCEPAQNLVQRQTLTPSGGTFKGKPATPGKEFVASPDSWFRPVFSANGPDGAAYICDMYRKILDHPRYLPEHIRDKLDYSAGKSKGRIYRLTRKGALTARPRSLSSSSTKNLIKALDSPNAWPRETAYRLLLASADKTVLKALRTARLSRPAARVAANRLITNRGSLQKDEILKMLNDPSPRVREHGIQLAEADLSHPPIAVRIRQLAADRDPLVRFNAALALGFDDPAARTTALAAIADTVGSDEWTAAAVMSSLGLTDIEYVARHLLATGNGAKAPALMPALGQAAGRAATDAQAANLVRLVSQSKSTSDIEWKTAFVDAFSKGLRARGLGKGKSPFADLAARTKTTANVNWLFDLAAELAADSKANEPARIAAIQFLANSTTTAATKALQSLLNVKESATIQSAAIATLGKFGNEDIGAWLVAPVRWHAYSPNVRNAVIAALLGHSKLIPLLFTAIEDGRIPAWAVPEVRRRGLLRHKTLKDRATKLFSAIGGTDRKKVYDELKPLTEMKGDVAKGKLVFTKACATCHKFNGEGHTVGPDLTGVRNQPKDAILLHVIVPNAEIYPGFTAYEIETKDDRTLSGIMTSETENSITLRAAQGIEETFLRSDVASVRAGSTSLMPNELEKTITKAELTDLLEYLKSN